jgi:DNA-binding transcriptional regulator PaaX/predicted TIM-barrel fold metal-dependent hydrolase
MPIIDTHAHIFPGDFGPAPAGCDPAAWPSVEDGPDPDTRLLVNGPMRFPAKRVWFDAERRLEASAGAGLDAELLSPFPALLNYRVPGPLGRDLCRVTNEYIAGLVAAYPAKFYGLGTIPLQDPDLAAAELSETAKLGLAGVEIASNINGVSLHDPRLDGFWAEAERLGTAVFIHGMPVPSDRVPGPAVATFGVGAEASLGAASVIAGGVAEKYPNLKISFSHAGGGFPLILTRAQWFWGRTWNEEPPLPEAERPEAAPWFAEHSPVELARRFYYDSLVFDRRAIRYLADMFGTDRLLVGSDYPAMTREQPVARTLRSMGLSEAELDDVLWNNCFRFLGIDPPKLSSFYVGTTVSSLTTFIDPLEDDGVSQPWTSPGAVAQRPPRLLLTLLGDYWWQRTEPLPSAAIVALLAEFGVSDSAARAALSRLTRNGLLVTSRSGRRTYVQLSARAADVLDDGARRIFSFGRRPTRWDGMWSLVAFSIPEEHRSARDELRKALRWLGFAPLYDGLWVSPRDHAGEVIGRLKDLGITTATAFRATALPLPGGGPAGAGAPDIPARAWDLSGLRERYEEFNTFAGLLRDQTEAGQLSIVDALVARTRVMNEWRAFPALDPDLPDELLPAAWPRASARELFIACYDLLGPIATRRVRQIIARYSPELAIRAAYHNTELVMSDAGAA